jgi:predicted AlkP superfamily pyrophosphatase or phosphodiesterase
MHRTTLFLLCLLSVASLSISASFPCSGGTGPIPAKDRIVIVISLDGFPAYAFEDPTLPTPTLWRLAREGAMARGMVIAFPAPTRVIRLWT